MNRPSFMFKKLSSTMYKFHTCTPKLSNQNVVFIWYGVLIGCFWSMRSKLLLKFFFMTIRPGLKVIKFWVRVFYSYSKIVQSCHCSNLIWRSDWMFLLYEYKTCTRSFMTLSLGIHNARWKFYDHKACFGLNILHFT